MNISILSVFPQLYTSFLETSIIKKAQDQNLVRFDLCSFFSHVVPKERIDAPTFGHGAGMLIKPDVVQKAVESQEEKWGKSFKIFFSPQGKKLDQRLLKKIKRSLVGYQHLMLLPARYEGMDARVEQEYADEIISVGDFVLMGGDIPAMMLLEGLLRLMPGVVGKAESVEADSFTGPLVDYPEFTHPIVWKNKEVPEVLRSGDHGRIKKWQNEQSLQRTVTYHFDWLRTSCLSNDKKKEIITHIPPHYIALLHNEIIVQDDGLVGHTSVTSLDIHDIARSAKTYGIKQYFIVTDLIDQQKIVRKLLDFWQEGGGVTYNASRHRAVKQVELQSTLDQVIQAIEKKEGKAPVIIATSAKVHEGITVSYFDQARVWAQNKPVLIIFGTGKGLAPEVLKRCDFILGPLQGFIDYNHLSVRSAAAIVLDRWLGINPKECG